MYFADCDRFYFAHILDSARANEQDAASQKTDSKDALMTSVAPVLETTFTDLNLLRRGKVRDVYEVDQDRLLIVATDRISAFDSVSPTPIERKGEVLTAL